MKEREKRDGVEKGGGRRRRPFFSALQIIKERNKKGQRADYFLCPINVEGLLGSPLMFELLIFFLGILIEILFNLVQDLFGSHLYFPFNAFVFFFSQQFVVVDLHIVTSFYYVNILSY